MARDSQRTKLYRAERAFWNNHAAGQYTPDFNKGGFHELVHQVESIWADAAVKKAFPEIATRPVPNVKTNKRRGAHAAPYFNELAFSQGTCQPWVVIHELAHIIHYRIVFADGQHATDQADHGPEYAAVYLRLTEICFGFEAREGLAASFRKGRVKIAPKVVRARKI